jgi:hypothetical protein
MEKDTVNQDRNLIGRLGALVVIIAVVVGLGRLCGGGVCPMGGRMCPFFSHGQETPAAPAAPAAPEAPAAPATPTK